MFGIRGIFQGFIAHKITTFFIILGCMDIPSDGEYYLNGKKISGMKDRELSKVRNETLSFIFQNFALMHNYSVYKNVALPLFKKAWS